jgi:flavin reductase (DIM6/NTAB) family NADH-FMN oxidoreductase RutF/DNA-binding IclR family transcriptional regulator
MTETTSVEAPLPGIDPRRFRDVLGHYPTGVVVITGLSPEGTPLGMVVGTFSSVSLEPPLVSFMPTAASSTYADLRRAPLFCINVLAYDQRPQTRILSQRDPGKFDKVKWTMSDHGVPILDGAVAYIHCSLAEEIEAGDHRIVLCDVQDVEVARPVTPLLFFQGGYGGFTTSVMDAYVDSDLISAVRVAEVARPQLTVLAERFDCEAIALVEVTDHDQTVGASVRSASVTMFERLGTRLPLIPPVGGASVAWSEAGTAKWLARIFPPDPAVIDAYRERLGDVRAHGYVVHRKIAGLEDKHAQLTEALTEYALGELMPARERAVQGAIAPGVEFFGTDISDDEIEDDVVSITVPVFDPSVSELRGSGLSLRLSSLPGLSTGAQTRERVAALQTAAAEVRDALGGSHRADYDRYVGSGLRDRARD